MTFGSLDKVIFSEVPPETAELFIAVAGTFAHVRLCVPILAFIKMKMLRE
jgi:hypothetical protein